MNGPATGLMSMFSSTDLYAGLSGEPLSLSRKYQSLFTRLPRTFLVSNLVELRKWPTFFEPEKAYFRELLKQLSEFSAPEFGEIFGSLESLEARTGCDKVSGDSPEELQDRMLALLQRQGQYSHWRAEIEKIFKRLEPLVESRLYSGLGERRLVVILYGEGITIEREKLWSRLRKIGVRVPLELGGAESSEAFLQSLFSGHPDSSPNAARPTIFDLRRDSPNSSPLDSWVIEAGDALHKLCESGEKKESVCATGMSYDRLRAYRDRLTETIYSKVLSGVHSPLELSAYLKTLRVKPQEGVALYYDDVVLNFIRDTFLQGAGTLIINNTFVEWGAVQALRRAQPRLLVARFGVRDKLKPFSSLLLFSKPRPTDQIPILQDPLGSFVDAELLAYYIWLNAEKGLPYRDHTLYLLLAEDVDEMLAVAPSSRGTASKALPSASLPDVAATMAHWLGLELPGISGRAIEPIVV